MNNDNNPPTLLLPGYDTLVYAIDIGNIMINFIKNILSKIS